MKDVKEVLNKIKEVLSKANFAFMLYAERCKDKVKQSYRALKVRLKKVPWIYNLWKEYKKLKFKIEHSQWYLKVKHKIIELKEKYITSEVRKMFWTIKRSTGYKITTRFAIIILTIGVALGILNKGLDNKSAASAYREGSVPAVLHAGYDVVVASVKPTESPEGTQVIPSAEPELIIPSIAPKPTKKPQYQGFVATEDNSAWLASARINIYDENKFFTYKNRQYYKDENFAKSYTVIDVSSYQGDIKWDRVKAHGVKAARMRLGLRGYVSGKISEDTQFKKNIEGAAKNGLDVGVYFFSQAINEREAIQEANYVIDKVKKYNITMPIAYDGEHVSDASARTNVAKLNNQQRTDICIAFCETIKKAGYVPMIYDNKSHLEGGFQLSRLNGYYIWYARYAPKPDYKYAYEMWQYTESGKVAGVKTLVDLSVCTVDFPIKIALMKKEGQ